MLPSRESVATLTSQMLCAARTRSSKRGSSPAVPGTNAVSNRCPENPSSSSAASSAPYSGKCEGSVACECFEQATTSHSAAPITLARRPRLALDALVERQAIADFDLIVEELRPTVRLSDSTDK